MIWMFRSEASRHAARIEVAETAETLREQLSVVRDVTEALGPDVPEWDGARTRAKVTYEKFFTAVGHLPRAERKLAVQWEHAASMTYWYVTGDRSFAPLEERAAGLLATLPEGLDRSAAREMVDAIIHHTELALRSLSPRRTDDNDETPTVVNQKGLRDRIADDRARLTFQGTFGTETVALRQAHRHYFPWITETLTYLSEPRSRTELEAVAEQWRNERVKYVYDNPQNANITIATTA
ncbi:hypothetical protein [Rhodococcus sp. WY5]|uniref:hypothetical protein n=1 Tax=Rhodococcus sp. WY5 TaxID=2708349 RepID=UPI001BDF38BC|nr:hypothetical protein [Rhodococcus sp. WY5]